MVSVGTRLSLLGLAGCVTAAPPPRPGPAVAAAHAPVAMTAGPSAAVTQASHSAIEPPAAKPPAPSPGQSVEPTPSRHAPGPGVGLPDMIRLTVERNPRLAQVGWAVETARGRAVQAGLYPNPTLIVTGDELGDRAGPGGIWTAPYVQQEIVRGDKLGLGRAVALKEVDQAGLTVIAERYRLFTNVRQNFYEVVTLQTRAEILREFVRLNTR